MYVQRWRRIGSMIREIVIENKLIINAFPLKSM
jgi:hypothetical protein